ncbi:MAG TPA: hypothetical protein PKW95_05615 [bacterium]|nr:hypothetical protein [bacterium]
MKSFTPFFCLLAVLSLSFFMLAAFGCDDDDDDDDDAVDDDDSVDDDAGDDDLTDDDLTDDDLSDDDTDDDDTSDDDVTDDDTTDDDTTDDDTSDDDTGDDDTVPAPETRLLLLAQDGAWHQTDDGWTEETIPDVGEFITGPSLMVNGVHLYYAWNQYVSIPMILPGTIEFSTSNAWIDRDNAGQWRTAQRQRIGFGWNVHTLAYADGRLWAGSQKFFFTYSVGGDSGTFTDRLFNYEGVTPVEARDCGEYSAITALAAWPGGDVLLGRYNTYTDNGWDDFDGTQWTSHAMPDGRKNHLFSDIVAVGDDWAFGVVSDGAGVTSFLYEYTGGEWTEIALPASCPTGFSFNRLEGTADLLLGYNTHSIDKTHVLEYRDGEWACREFVPQQAHPNPEDALVLENGYAYLAGNYNPSSDAFVLEFGPEGVEYVELPAGLKDLLAVHATGVDAPEQSPAWSGY